MSERRRRIESDDNIVQYNIQSLSEWSDVEADLVVVDPPFGIEFSGDKENYARDKSQVVSGYVEWKKEQYEKRISELLNTIHKNLAAKGQAVIFSGWNNSHIIHSQIKKSELNLEGKLYWSYNFAPYCKIRPSHNVYEIFWVTKDKNEWTYNRECSYSHCQEGEANLSHMYIKRDYHKNMPKYPTRLPEEVVGVLLEHFSDEGDCIFDPCAGSGMVGVQALSKNRSAYLGDLNKEALDVFDELIEMRLD